MLPILLFVIGVLVTLGLVIYLEKPRPPDRQ